MYPQFRILSFILATSNLELSTRKFKQGYEPIIRISLFSPFEMHRNLCLGITNQGPVTLTYRNGCLSIRKTFEQGVLGVSHKGPIHRATAGVSWNYKAETSCDKSTHPVDIITEVAATIGPRRVVTYSTTRLDPTTLVCLRS